MKVSLEKNGQDNDGVVPYIAHVELPTTTPDTTTRFNIPVYLQHLRDKTVYHAEVCGFPINGHTPQEITPGIERLLPFLINSTRLPTYVFIARHSRRLYPVYTAGDEVYTIAPGGPIFRHVELAKVREYLTDYLKEIGQLWRPGNKDRLHVRGVHKDTLSLIRPIFYLKKRPQNKRDNEFWAPVFPSRDGERIYTYAASNRREEVIEAGQEVLHLRRQVAQALIADKRLQESVELRADRVMEPYWRRLVAGLNAFPGNLVCPMFKLEIYQIQTETLGVEYRPNDENRVSLHFGRDVHDLQYRVAQDFVRRGLISGPDALRIAT